MRRAMGGLRKAAVRVTAYVITIHILLTVPASSKGFKAQINMEDFFRVPSPPPLHTSTAPTLCMFKITICIHLHSDVCNSKQNRRGTLHI